MWFFYLFFGGVCLFTKNYSDYSSIFTSVFCPPPLLKISSEFLFFWKASQDARSTVPSPNSALFSRIHVVCLGAWKGFRKLWRVLQWPYDPLKQKNPHLVIVACLCLKQTIQPTFCNFFASPQNTVGNAVFLNCDYCFHFTSRSGWIFCFPFVQSLLQPLKIQDLSLRYWLSQNFHLFH